MVFVSDDYDQCRNKALAEDFTHGAMNELNANDLFSEGLKDVKGEEAEAPTTYAQYLCRAMTVSLTLVICRLSSVQTPSSTASSRRGLVFSEKPGNLLFLTSNIYSFSCWVYYLESLVNSCFLVTGDLKAVDEGSQEITSCTVFKHLGSEEIDWYSIVLCLTTTRQQDMSRVPWPSTRWRRKWTAIREASDDNRAVQ